MKLIVPDLKNEELEEGKKLLKEAKIKYEEEAEKEYSLTIKKGKITRTEPEAGKEITKEQELKIYVSKFPLLIPLFFLVLVSSFLITLIVNPSISDIFLGEAPRIARKGESWVQEDIVYVTKDVDTTKLNYYVYCISSKKSSSKCVWKRTDTKNVKITKTGKWYVYFRGIYKDGEKSRVSNRVEVLVDNDAPIINVLEKDVNEEEVIIKINASDKGSGIEKYYYKLDDGQYKEVKSKFTLSNLEKNKDYTLVIRVIDKAGNVYELEEIINIDKILNDSSDDKNQNEENEKDKDKNDNKDDDENKDKDDDKETNPGEEPGNNKTTTTKKTTTKKTTSSTTKKTGEKDEIPKIDLSDVPSSFEYGEYYDLPSHVDYGTKGGSTVCYLGNKTNEIYINTKHILPGTHTITCIATNDKGKKATVKKEVTVEPTKGKDEIIDGWIKLNLYYPENSTNRQWRIGKENEIVDGYNNTGWQDYTGPILVRMSDVENIFLKYEVDGVEVIISPHKLLIDISPDKYTLVEEEKTKVKITCDKTAEVCEYRINSGEWKNYEGVFEVGSNTLIEARVLKNEDILDDYGNKVETKKIQNNASVWVSAYIPVDGSTPTPGEPGGPGTGGSGSGGTGPVTPGTSGPGVPGEYTPAPEKPSTYLEGPIITSDPSTKIVESTLVSVTPQEEASEIYISINYKKYQKYDESVEVKENALIRAYYIRKSDGKQSATSYYYVNNIKVKNLPYVKIDVSPSSYIYEDIEEAEVTISGSDYKKLEYSYNGVLYFPYTEALKVTTNATIYAKGTNENGSTVVTAIITTKTPAVKKDELMVNISLNPEKENVQGLINKVEVTIDYDASASKKYYKIGSSGKLMEYVGPFEVDENTTIMAYAISESGYGETSKSIDYLTKGIEGPIISINPKEPTETVKVSIKYPNSSIRNQYRINSGEWNYYIDPFYVEENVLIEARAENILGDTSTSEYLITNIAQTLKMTVINKGDYFIIKLNYPSSSEEDTREYKFGDEGEWKKYNPNGILILNSNLKDSINQEQGVIIEGENGKKITFKDDYYFADAPFESVMEDISMRWGDQNISSPTITLTNEEPCHELKAVINYGISSISKKYRVVKIDGSDTGWLDYIGPIEVTENGTTIYAKSSNKNGVSSKIVSKKITNVDNVPPVITVNGDFETKRAKVTIQLIGTDNLEFGRIAYVSGEHDANYFFKNGKFINNKGTIKITENGKYTIYGEDKAGNVTVKVIEVTNIDNTISDIDINVLTEEYGITAEVEIEYNNLTKPQYSIGNNKNYKDYTGTFTIKSNDVLNLADEEGNLRIYASGLDINKQKVETYETIYVLDLDAPKAPIVYTTSGYPLLTEYGVKIGEDNYIAYDDRDDITNYYSVDGGNTWEIYTGPVKIISGVLKAKSVKKDSGLTIESENKATMPSNALGVNAYDKDENTSEKLSTSLDKYINISSELIGKQIEVKYSYGSYETIIFTFFDESNKAIETKQLGCTSNCPAAGGYYKLTVPEGTNKLRIKHTVYASSKAYIYEIRPYDTPIINEIQYYPTITEDGIESGYNEITINYFGTSVQRLYSLDNGDTWLNYPYKPIRVNFGKTVLVKGIDKYGIETDIVEYTSKLVANGLGENAYDEDESTSEKLIVGSDKFLNISEEMRGKKIITRYSYGRYETIIFIFYDENDNVIKTNQLGCTSTCEAANTSYQQQIPKNAVKIQIRHTVYATSNAYIYEIKVSSEPGMYETHVYPNLTLSGIEESYDIVQINYLPKLSQRLYSIDSGLTWEDYIKPIKANIKAVIQAKAILKDNTESTIASYTVVGNTDEMNIEAFDNNANTTVNIEKSQTKYFTVSKEVIGRNLRVFLGNKPASDSKIIFYNEKGKVLAEASLKEYLTNMCIPKNSYKVGIYSGTSNLIINDINLEGINLSTEGKEPVITINTIDWAATKTVNINYPTGYINEYSLDLGESWNIYEKTIIVDKPSIIIARSIDGNNQVQASSSFTINKIDDFEPVIELNLPPKTTIGSSFALPTSFKVGKSGGYTKCYSSGEEIRNVRELELGKHEITCTVTNNVNVTKTITKTINIVEMIEYTGDSILSIIEKDDLVIGNSKFIVNDEEYSVHLYVLDGNQTFTTNQIFGDEYDVGTANSYAKNMVIVKVNGDLTIEKDVTVGPYYTEYGGPKGFTLYVTGKLENKGTIDNSHGAYAEGQDVYLWKNADGTYEYVPAVGGAGATRTTAENASGKSGEDGIKVNKRALGGGGAGGSYGNSTSLGGNATSYSGGSGGGGHTGGSIELIDASNFGGVGGSGYYGSGGAGNPGGTGTSNGESGTGGLLIIYSKEFNNTGTISAVGKRGGNSNYNGGSSGGGSINIFTDQQTGINQLGLATSTKYAEMLGNASSAGGAKVGNSYVGGAGGVGTINIGKIRNGQYYDLKEIIEQDKEAYKNSVTKTGESIISILNDNTLKSGYWFFKVNDEEYPVHLYELEGNQIWTENKVFGDALDVATANTYAQNMVIVKINGNLTIETGVSVRPYYTNYGGPKGFTLYVTGKLTNNGTIDNSHGAYAEGQNVYLWKNANGTYEYVPAVGGAGAAIGGSSRPGNAGKNGDGRQTGGGGSGALAKNGAGSAGTSYSGGTGGGGCTGTPGSPNGGAGGNGLSGDYSGGGGAGNPGGTGISNANGSNGTGGLLIIYANEYINNGTVSATGSNGGRKVVAGGSSGGGSINIFALQEINSKGSVKVNGGAKVASGTDAGGAGGAGTVNYTIIS